VAAQLLVLGTTASKQVLLKSCEGLVCISAKLEISYLMQNQPQFHTATSYQPQIITHARMTRHDEGI